MNPRQAFRQHWPEYLIEAWTLGTFMLAAAVVTVLVESPGSALQAALASPLARRVVIGVAMGATAVALIYSPWGQRSGAHMNPAVTLTFYRLGKVSGIDAGCYVAAQFLGGSLGMLLGWRLLGDALAMPPVSFAITAPGAGTLLAFAAEFAISAALMLTVLTVSNHGRLAPYTGLCAGLLVAFYISFEAPLSGMSMNPARSFASAAPAGHWDDLWIYFTAPLAGMLAAAQVYRAVDGRTHCAKLMHSAAQRCIHCGYEPARPGALATSSEGATHAH